MFNKCYWLPKKAEIFRGENSDQYLSRIYPIFVHDFINSHPVFLGKRVLYNTLPITHGYEEAFFHITHVDQDHLGFEHRQIDYARSECLPWIKQIIDHYPCRNTCCNGLKAWRVKNRIHILFEDVRFLIVISKRGSSYQLVTAFILNRNHELEKKLRQYEQYKNYPL